MAEPGRRALPWPAPHHGTAAARRAGTAIAAATARIGAGKTAAGKR